MTLIVGRLRVGQCNESSEAGTGIKYGLSNTRSIVGEGFPLSPMLQRLSLHQFHGDEGLALLLANVVNVQMFG